jgi:hypothetical protein
MAERSLVSVRRWGIRVGSVWLVWYDLWERKFAFEISRER